MKKKIPLFFLLLCLIVLSSFFDLKVSSHLISKPTPIFWILVYKYFFIVPVASFIVILIMYLYSLIKKINLISGKSILYLFCFLTLSQGLIHLSKRVYGRPRPKEISNFNVQSNYSYQPPFKFKGLKPYPQGQSFPSGHSGFSFSLIYFYFIFRRKKISSVFLSTSIIYGSFVGLGRIIQGAHFLSDVTGSFVFVYISADLLYSFFYKKNYTK